MAQRLYDRAFPDKSGYVRLPDEKDFELSIGRQGGGCDISVPILAEESRAKLPAAGPSAQKLIEDLSKVSRKHAKLVRKDGIDYLVDTSSNGTVVMRDDQEYQVSKELFELKPCDSVYLGRVYLLYYPGIDDNDSGFEKAAAGIPAAEEVKLD